MDGEACILHDRALSAVVALGLFAVESELKVRKFVKDIVTDY